MAIPLERIETKLDRVIDTQTQQAVVLERCTTSIEHHVKRTDLLESQVQPLAAAHQRWVGAGKATAAVGAVIAALAGLAAVAEFMAHVWGHFK